MGRESVVNNIIIDFEFTGLDNDFVLDNEIIQAKAINSLNGKSFCKNYHSKKELCAYSFLSHKVKRYTGDLFSLSDFMLQIESILDDKCKEIKYFGFGVSQDLKMLAKYKVHISINDIREMLQRSKFDSKIATEGSGLESVYYIVTGKVAELNSHDGVNEVHIIKELYDAACNEPLSEYINIMPHGFCSGMPISKYVSEYRRQSDGYRYNNNDILSKSLSKEIELQEASFFESEGDFDDFND